MRLTATMKTPLAIALPTITCSHSGCVSKSGCSGSEPIADARARPEVAVLVVSGRHGDVQLAGAAQQAPVRRDQDRRVVAQPVIGVGALVQRRVHVRSGLAS